jgi:hypothetical protein
MKRITSVGLYFGRSFWLLYEECFGNKVGSFGKHLGATQSNGKVTLAYTREMPLE